MAECVVCGVEVSRLYACCECGRLVCDLCYVEAVDMCTDCEETWETEEDLNFLQVAFLLKMPALRVNLRYIVRGLEHEFLFEQEYVEDVACTDEVDRAILEELHYAGPYGMLPRDVASRVKEYKLKPWNVTQRLRRMNKKLDRLIRQKVAEKVGKGWALTTFLREA